MKIVCFIHHNFHAGEISFRSHFLVFINFINAKKQRLSTIQHKLDKQNNPPNLRDTILQFIDNYYNDELKHESIEMTFEHQQSTTINQCLKKQKKLGRGYFIIGIISSSFHVIINCNYRSNHIDRRFKFSSWFRFLV